MVHPSSLLTSSMIAGGSLVLRGEGIAPVFRKNRTYARCDGSSGACHAGVKKTYTSDNEKPAASNNSLILPSLFWFAIETSPGLRPKYFPRTALCSNYMKMHQKLCGTVVSRKLALCFAKRRGYFPRRNWGPHEACLVGCKIRSALGLREA